jgi:hypothetical protein
MKRRRRKSPALRRAKCTARDNPRTMATPVNDHLLVPYWSIKSGRHRGWATNVMQTKAKDTRGLRRCHPDAVPSKTAGCNNRGGRPGDGANCRSQASDISGFASDDIPAFEAGFSGSSASANSAGAGHRASP